MPGTARVLMSKSKEGKATIAAVGSYLEDLDWDDPSIPLRMRHFLLEAEAYANGISEGLNDEAELKALILHANLTCC